MPKTEINDIDAYLDRYARGKLSQEEELEFEAIYLDNPAVLAKIEEIQRLKGVLKEAQAITRAQPDTFIASWKKAFQYLIVPQTGWGALAATLIFIPALFFASDSNKEDSTSTTSVYLLESISVRSDESSKERNFPLTLTKEQKNIVLGFVVEPYLGQPSTWTLDIVDEQQRSIWHGEKLQPDFQSVIYLSIDSRLLRNSRYRYHLLSERKIKIEGDILISRE